VYKDALHVSSFRHHHHHHFIQPTAKTFKITITIFIINIMQFKPLLVLLALTTTTLTLSPNYAYRNNLITKSTIEPKTLFGRATCAGGYCRHDSDCDIFVGCDECGGATCRAKTSPPVSPPTSPDSDHGLNRTPGAKKPAIQVKKPAIQMKKPGRG